MKRFLIKLNLIRKRIKSFFEGAPLSAVLFHKFYYKKFFLNKTGKELHNTYWMGVPILKCPFDLWVYQEIIFENKPDKIIECGTSYGGSALYFASLLDVIGRGEVISVDIKDFPDKPEHKRIKHIVGSSISEDVLKTVKSLIKENEKIMVSLDSNHRRHHVLKELELWSPMVSVGQYLIVEDSNINGHPVYANYGPGPMEAIKIFLRNSDNFIVDKNREKYSVTFNPKGYLKRVR